MNVEWDPVKDRQNQRKHGISFEVAKSVFRDPHRIEVYDDRDYGEDRWAVIGQIGRLVAYVVYTERHGIVRLISARKADEDDEAEYLARRL